MVETTDVRQAEERRLNHKPLYLSLAAVIVGMLLVGAAVAAPYAG